MSNSLFHQSANSQFQVFIVVLAMLISGLTIGFGLRGDYPVRVENDEAFYFYQGGEMSSRHYLDPPMSCNPASTVIYPLTLYYSLVNFCSRPSSDEYQTEDERAHKQPFLRVMVPRIACAAITIAIIPFLFLLCRSLFTVRAAACAILLYAVQPLVVEFGQIVRSDNVALFFEVLTLYWGFRLLARGNRLDRIGTAISFGLALGSRYFMLALMPFIFLIDLAIFRRKKRPLSKIAETLYTSVLGFLVFLASTPFFVLDFSHYMNDLYLETITPCLGVDNLSPIGNALFYLNSTIPYYFSQPLLFLAGIGALAALLRRDIRYNLLLMLIFLFFVGTCMNRRHWHRWMLPLVPILLMFIGHAVDLSIRFFFGLARLCLSRASTSLKIRARQLETGLGILLMLGAVGYLSLPAAEAIVRYDLAKNTYATDVQMYYWIKENLPKKTPICVIGIWELPDRADYNIMDYLWGPEYFDSQHHGVFYTIPQICAKGYHLFIVKESQAEFCRLEPVKFAREVSVFNYLEKHAKLLKQFEPTEIPNPLGGYNPVMRGSLLKIYEMPPLAPPAD